MKKKQVLYIFLFLLFISRTPVNAMEPPTSLELNIPEFKVTKVGDIDHVDIPGGELFIAEEGRPKVPYYIKTVNFPKGYRVQDVILKERYGLKTTTGLKLPIVILNPYPNLPVEMTLGWYPEKDYDWQVLENNDGSTTLIITVFSFYYNPRSTDIKFYRNYKFDINYIISTVSITDLVLGKDTYQPGDKIAINIDLINTGSTRDVIASIIIKTYGSEEIVDSLPLRFLKNLTEDATLLVDWNSGNTEPGYYYAEATLIDAAGNILDRLTKGFSLKLLGNNEKIDKTSDVYFIIIVNAIITVIAIILLLVMIKRFIH